MLSKEIRLGSPSQSWAARSLRTPRVWVMLVAALSLILLLMLFMGGDHPRETVETFLRPIHQSPVSQEEKQSQRQQSVHGLHLLLPASRPDINLCKLLLGASLLGYPNPVLTAWGDEFHNDGILGGGSHIGKVSKVLEYLKSLPEKQDKDIVFMMDAYDIWLQLPATVLLERYHNLTAEAQARMVDYHGPSAVESGNLQELVMFGAGKRCAPNQSHTVACYALADSPLPDDLYGENTDSVIGRNYWYSFKQRYLNSGYIIGQVGPMRKMFEEAWTLIQNHPDMDPTDDGSHGSDFMYHGSDQSIFASMYGRQEWAREKLRLAHAPAGTKPRSSQVLGNRIDNVLDPNFEHEKVDLDLSSGNNPWEFGMYLDFWSDIGHQTVNSELDGQWFTYGNQPVKDQLIERNRFDCPARIPDGPPADVLNSSMPLIQASNWHDRTLYTHLCMSRVPVLLHHNGIKERREWDWPWVWYQKNASAMMSELKTYQPNLETVSFNDAKSRPGLRSVGGAWSDKGELLSWEQLCPAEWNPEIFRHD